MKMKVTADVNKAYILPRCIYENNVFDNLVVFFSVHKAYVYVFMNLYFFLNITEMFTILGTIFHYVSSDCE